MKKIISLLVALLTLAACSDTLNEGSNQATRMGWKMGASRSPSAFPTFKELTRAGEGIDSLNAVAYDNTARTSFQPKNHKLGGCF